MLLKIAISFVFLIFAAEASKKGSRNWSKSLDRIDQDDVKGVRNQNKRITYLQKAFDSVLVDDFSAKHQYIRNLLNNAETAAENKSYIDTYAEELSNALNKRILILKEELNKLTTDDEEYEDQTPIRTMEEAYAAFERAINKQAKAEDKVEKKEAREKKRQIRDEEDDLDREERMLKKKKLEAEKGVKRENRMRGKNNKEPSWS